MSLPSEPITRKEQYLAKAAGQAVEIPSEPITREEAYLDAIAKGSGGGGGGTKDYSQLENKPQIAGTTLQGNKSLSDLGIASATALGDVSNAVTAITDGQTINSFSAVETALSNKQDTLTFDNAPTENSNNPVKSGGVKSAIDAAVASAYHHAGTKTCAELTAGLLVAGNEGNVYNMTDSGTTTADFIEGQGQPIKEGDNVGIAKISDGVYKFDLLSGFVDTSNFVQKSETAGLLQNDGTIDTTIQGDVSSLKSGLTNLDNEVNGDAVEYPYADVITIPDAVPANVADCAVRIEPVQDLHGYDKPWVGGAGKNKAYVNINSGETSLTEIKDNDNNVIGVNADVGAAGVVVTVKMATVSIENGKTYTLSGSPNDKSNSTYRLDVRTQAQGQLYNNWNEIDNPTITATEDVTLDIYLRIAANYAVNNLVFHPQIEEGSTTTTFAPYTNLCPITGHTEASVQRDGRNLLNPTKFARKDPNSGNASNNWAIWEDYIRCNYNDSLTLNCGIGHVRIYRIIVSCFDKYMNHLGNISETYIYGDGYTFTINIAGTKYCRVQLYNATSMADYDFSTAQLEYGSTATTYEPYAGKTYTIQLGDTIYGGTVDFDTGVMTVDRAIVDLGTFTWSYNSDGFFYTADPSGMKQPATSSDKPNWMLTCYDAVSYNSFVNVYANGTAAEGNGYIRIANTAYTDATDFKTAMTGQKLVYELATPFTVQLTPQQIQLLKGQNTLTASTGQISVTVNGVRGAIGQVQEQANATDEALAELAADIAEQLPTAPTTDGAYVLTVTVADGTPTYSWESTE